MSVFVRPKRNNESSESDEKSREPETMNLHRRDLTDSDVCIYTNLAPDAIKRNLLSPGAPDGISREPNPCFRRYIHPQPSCGQALNIAEAGLLYSGRTYLAAVPILGLLVVCERRVYRVRRSQVLWLFFVDMRTATGGRSPTTWRAAPEYQPTIR
jgi:hypothetical protein